MRPYGYKYQHHNFVDNHPPKGYVNWWEFEMIWKSKKTDRQKGKKQIEEQLLENESK